MTPEQRAPEKDGDTNSTPSKLKRAWIGSFSILLMVVVLLLLLESIYTNLSEKGWTSYTSENSGLIDDLVNALAIDEAGRVWVGTWVGLSVLAPDGSWRTYTSEDSDLASGRVLALAIDQKRGGVLVGTRPGLSVLAPDGSWTTYTSGLLSNDVNALAIDDRSRVWVGARPGLSVLFPTGFRSSTYTSENSGLVHNSVQALVIDEGGRVWVGTSGGLSVLAPDGSWSTYTSENSGLIKNFVGALAIDEAGWVWVGSARVMSVLAPDGSWTSYASEDSGRVNDEVNALAIDAGGRVWVGTFGGGLSMLAPDGSWTTYTSDDSGLANDGINALAIDEAGYVWVGSFRGLSRFDERAATSQGILQPLATVITFLKISRTLAALSLVIITIGSIRARRKPSEAPALEPAPIPASRAQQGQPGTLSVPAAQAPADPQSALTEGKMLLGQGKKDEAIAFLMHAFREGPPDVRREASHVLEELGEMKTF